MKFPFFIAKRYIISKKSHNIINIITTISIIGVTVGTMALVIVLSVFNGFENLIVKSFNVANADIKITPTFGKTISTLDFPLAKIKEIKYIKETSKTIEESALISYNNLSLIGVIKGIEKQYIKINNIDTCIIEGRFALHNNEQSFAVVGREVGYALNVNINDVFKPISIHIPRRTSNISDNPTEIFNIENILPIGIYSTGHENDAKQIYVPFEFAEKIMEYENEFSSLEVSVEKNKIEKVKKELINILGEKYTVKDRFEQEASLYKILNSEKFATYLILTFILIIATFNIIGSLSMLIIDKKKDINILKSIGANNKLIKRIFFTEGMLISWGGTMLGLLLGTFICFLQYKFSLIVITSQETGNYLPYPIDIKISDLLIIFATVTFISSIASWYATRKISPILNSK